MDKKKVKQGEKALWELAEEVLKPDKNGVSKKVTTEEMVKHSPRLAHNNGCSWGRDDGPLARKYNLIRTKKGGRVVAYQTLGFADRQNNRIIRPDIKDIIINMTCAATGSNPTNRIVECDHKNGRYDDPRLENPATQRLSDFQPLHRSLNLIKRGHCTKCTETGQRFDARNIGFQIPWTTGGLKRKESADGCIGCYWHDVKDFNAKASKSD